MSIDIDKMRAEVAEWEAERIAVGYCKRRCPTAPAPFTRDLLMKTTADARPFFTRLAKLILDSGEIPQMDSDKLHEWQHDFRIAGMSPDILVSSRAMIYEMTLRHVLRDCEPWRASTLLDLLYSELSQREHIDLYGYTKEMLVYDYDEEYAKAERMLEQWQQLQLQNSKED